MGSIPLPKPISIAQFNAPAGEPTYTDIYNQTVGALDPHFAAIDANSNELAALADAMAGELAAENTIDTVGTAVTLFGSIDPSGLDTHIANFEASKPIGLALIADAAGHTPPLLLELPMSLNFDGGIGIVPSQIDVDLGTLKIGGPPVQSFIDQTVIDPSFVTMGVQDVGIYDRTGGDWEITEVDREFHSGYVKTNWFLQYTPVMVGSFIAQVNVLYVGTVERKIITYKVTVTP